MYMCLQTMFVILCTRFMTSKQLISVTSMSYEELKEQYLQFSVYDFDRFSRNDLIGQVVLKELLDCTEQEIEYTMEILCAMQVTNMNFRFDPFIRIIVQNFFILVRVSFKNSIMQQINHCENRKIKLIFRIDWIVLFVIFLFVLIIIVLWKN